ncbi:eCIS core domain-containing protein [Luteimonas sp. A482]
MKRYTPVFACLLTLATVPVLAWDPIGDITNPGRIIRNVGRELDNAGREVDRARIEAQAQAGAPVFEQWLAQSRDNSINDASPIPPHIKQQLSGFYDEDVLQRARFRIGDAGVFNLASLSVQYGGAEAVALIDVIVFKNAGDAYNNPILWAHELKHVQQFRDWGVRDFAIRYLRSWNGVEGEAYAAQSSYVNWSDQMAQVDHSSTGPAVQVANFAQPAAASLCATNLGVCGMGVAIPVGSSCYCPTFNGPIWGVAR